MGTTITTKDKKLISLVRKTVIETIQDIVQDPDYDLPFTLETIKRLKKSMQSKKAGRVVTLEKILDKYA